MDTQRPLIVAFMGGTGVGKSSLLNRLAQQEIAKTGIERPTSREVTVFYHHSLKLQQLPSELPLEKITLSQHSTDEHKNIIWIDMPDFDSIELANKDLVLQWLPHVDVLVYVVSPERYKDNKAWQLLLNESQKHGWVFVINQWDFGHIEQYHDFKQQLSKAGFANPLVFKSSCLQQSDDEFVPLLDSIKSLANEHNIEQLEQRGLHVRKQTLQQQLKDCLPLLNIEKQYPELTQFWQKNWSQTEQILKESFTWSMREYAHQCVKKEEQLLARKNSAYLWDGWAQNRFDSLLDDVILNADQLQMPTTLIRENLQGIRQKAGDIIDAQAEFYCKKSLANPGNVLHRIFLKLSRFCEIVLPLIAMGFVGYQLLLGFYESTLDAQKYLGTDFAIHSSLLILISWLLPFFIRKKMQPSIEKAAFKGLQKGLEVAHLMVDDEVRETLKSMQKQQHQLGVELDAYINLCDEKTPKKIEPQSTLGRILVN